MLLDQGFAGGSPEEYAELREILTDNYKPRKTGE